MAMQRSQAQPPSEDTDASGLATLRDYKYDPEKLNVRANNFKVFRKSTSDLIKQLFDH